VGQIRALAVGYLPKVRVTIIMRSSTKSLVGAAVLAGALGSIVGCSDDRGRSSALAATPTSATEAKPLHLLDVDGQPFDLWQGDGNKATVVIFTRSDCPISNRYAPDIRQLVESFHPRGVDFYLVYVDPHEQPEAIRAHLRDYEYPCPGLRDPEHTLVAATGATVTPEAVVFDGKRKMVYRGRIDDRNSDFGKASSVAVKHDLADAIEATLAGQPVAEAETKAVGCYIGDLE
jgi:cytochrome oxidase Cu insertion factor (SCO1/SenC/PrrC family)